MKRHTKLTSQEHEQISEVKSAQTATREFASVEEMLRHDAGQTIVPPEVAERLGRSIQKLPPPPRSWWRRWLGS